MWQDVLLIEKHNNRNFSCWKSSSEFLLRLVCLIPLYGLFISFAARFRLLSIFLQESHTTLSYHSVSGFLCGHLSTFLEPIRHKPFSTTIVSVSYMYFLFLLAFVVTFLSLSMFVSQNKVVNALHILRSLCNVLSAAERKNHLQDELQQHCACEQVWIKFECK